MIITAAELPKEVTFVVPEKCRQAIADLCYAKDVSPQTAAMLLVHFACGPIEKVRSDPRSIC